MKRYLGGMWLSVLMGFVGVGALGSVGCGGNSTTVDGGPRDAGPSDGGGTGAGRRLAVVGPPLVSIQTGGSALLQVALVQENVGAVVGEPVTFEIVGNSGDSTLGGVLTATGVTDAGGLAVVTLDAGMTQTTFQVAASAAGANRVAFGVQIIQLQQIIQIARTPAVRVQANGTQAAVDTTAFTKVILRVRITDQFGNSLEGLPIYFSFQSTAKSATFVDTGTTPTTGAGGEAEITIDTGTDLKDTFIVTGRSNGSGTASWSVNLQDAGLKLCSSPADCPQGQICDANGLCAGAPGCDAAMGIDCPTGYKCSANNECLPVFGGICTDSAQCGNGFSCDIPTGVCQADTPACDAQNPCPSGFSCNGGACQPNAGPLPDIGGPWYTAHTFNIGDAIPFVNDIAGPLRTIDRLFLGDLGLPGWLQGLVDGLISNYIPSWVPKLIHVLDVIATLLQNLRARGYMQITQTDGAWTATEVWESFVFYDLTLCGSSPGGGATPACARVDLFVSGPGVPADLGLKVKPFNGTVSMDQVIVNQRHVEMRVAKLVGWLVDKLVDLFTPYKTLSEAIVAVIDCPAVGSFVDSTTGGWISASTATGVCNTVVSRAATTVTNALYGFAFDVGVLTFHGNASISALSGNQAQELGTATFETSQDGSYEGDFLTGALHSITGTWRASRLQIP